MINNSQQHPLKKIQVKILKAQLCTELIAQRNWNEHTGSSDCPGAKTNEPYWSLTYPDHVRILIISKMLSQYKLKPHYKKHKSIPGAPQSAPNKISPTPKVAQYALTSIYTKKLQERDHLPLKKPSDH